MGLDNRYGAFIDPELTVSPLGQGPLDGLTFAVKDVFAIRGHVSSAGNPDWLRSHEAAAEHAGAVKLLLEAGAKLRGAAHTDELMYSLGGENIHYGTPMNPRGKGRIPGGSSSGSAVAVASGGVDFAIGTDTGGSVRVPSSYCGIFGFRPSHGAVDMSGVIPLAPDFDTVGWMARSPEILLKAGEVLLGGAADGRRRRQEEKERAEADHREVSPAAGAAGTAEASGTAAAEPVPRSPEIRRLFLSREAWALADPACAGGWSGTLGMLQAEAEVCEERDIAPEGLKAWMGVFRELQGSQIWATHGEWIRKESPVFGPDIAARFAMAEELAGQDHAAAERFRREIAARLRSLLGEDGALVIPTVPGPAPLTGGNAERLERNRSGAMSLCCIAGLSGLPQITMPVDGPDGLALGLSVIGGFRQDLRLLSWIAKVWKAAPV